jgi:pyrroline-5-carboxylate reductase
VMAQETFVGAAMLLDQSGLSAAQLQSNVASKWWSTQAALDTMKAQGIETAVQNGLKSAYQRAKELNG